MSIWTGGGCGVKNRPIQRPRFSSSLFLQKLPLFDIPSTPAKKWMTESEYDRIFNEMLKRGFSVGDDATIDRGITPIRHPHTDRWVVYVLLDCVVELDKKPSWLIHPWHWRGALVCFLKNYNGGTIKKIKCVSRGPKSAWCEVVE